MKKQQLKEGEFWMKWCKSYYRLEFCNKVKDELRSRGFTVKVKDYLKENGQSYARVYILQNEFAKNCNDIHIK